MSSTYGENLKLTVFGQSHGPAVGMTLDGIPAGLNVDMEKLQQFLARRAPGGNNWSTSRKEADKPEFLAGIADGRTCGAPIAAVIHNTNIRSGDYENLKDIPRPGHADYTAQIKYGGFQDAAGGGHFSGRLTAPLCIAGGMCKQWLEEMGIRIGAHILRIGEEEANAFDPIDPRLDRIGCIFPTLTPQDAETFQQIISEAKSRGDSVDGAIECAVTGLPAGLGGPMFGGMEGKIAQIIYAIPGVKALEFGNTRHFGSENNDPFVIDNGVIRTATNNCGGILGGITNSMPVIFRVGIKPTPSIAIPQKSVNLKTMEEVTVQVRGRHDPCIVPRAVPVVEAAAAIAIFDLILGDPRAKECKYYGA